MRLQRPFGPGPWAALALAVSLIGCAPLARPTISHRGFVPDPEALSSVRVGIDNKNSVASRLGTPSAMADFSGETWYYISQTQRDFLYHRPRTTEQHITAIHFDRGDLVASIDNYGLDTAKKVNFSKQTTPTRGKELTFLEQMFGNFGRFSTNQEGDSPRPD